ncbi:MAG: hypothetical protein ACFB10_26225 [Salibacteraceae bacterium]
MRNFFWLLLLLVSFPTWAQEQEQVDPPKKILQFSGVVVSGDSLSPVPYTSILIRNTNRGTISDYYGFYSLVAETGDTIDFTGVGFRKTTYIIPDSLDLKRYSLIQIMTKDTIFLPESVIYPWPTKEQFAEAFMNLEVPEDDYDRAKKNLERVDLQERMDNLPNSGSITYKQQMRQYSSRLYYAGQAPPNNLLNPVAWARFIEAWKRGDFKRQ